MDKNRKPIRQGDILLFPVESLPKDAKRKKSGVVAYGEVTGHSHKIVGGEVFEGSGKLWVVAGNIAEIVHEEHFPRKIEKGIYQVWNEREFDYYEKDLRRVVD